MPSVLYSTTCLIKSDLYRLRIYTDDIQFNSEIENSLDFTSIDIPIQHITPALTRLDFQLLNEKKINTTIPQTITLNHLLNVKQIVSTLKNSTKSFNSSLQVTPSLEVNAAVEESLSFEQSREISQTTIATDNSQGSFKRRQFSFRRFLSSFSSPPSSTDLLTKTSIKISYVDVSNSIQWTIKTLELELDTEEIAGELYMNLNRCLSTLSQRPRRLLAFVNPLSGKGRARFVYDKKVLPIFVEANIFVQTIYTERANHAREYVLNEILNDYDGLICVGGDGMFAELCHGLLLRTAQDEQVNIDNPHVNLIRPKMRIGIIPAGSTDAVVFGTTGLNDPVTSALQIIVGESLPIDITTVHNENGFVRFMATMLAYGFFGDIIQQSDKWRCLGPLRYDLAGFCQFVRNTSYHSELTITLFSPESVQNTHSQTMNTTGCTSAVAPDCQQLITQSSDTIEKLVMPRPKFCSRNCGQCSGEHDANSNKNQQPLQIKREGRYTTINCLNMPCRCAKSKYGMSPFVHLGDGTFDLILVKRSWRTGFLRFLWQVANDSRTIEDLPNVERYRVSEVFIRPINAGSKQGSNWSCDGELIPGNEIQVRVHRQALNLFASGIQFEEKYQNENAELKSKNWFPCFRNKNKLRI